MTQLKLVTLNGQFLADSREVAEMTDTRHDHLLAKIDAFTKVLSTDPNFRVSDFFILDRYQDSTGRTLKRYLITRKGCDMVANKMTGEKGVLFTATYVTKFEEMERKQNEPTYTDIEKFLYNPDTIIKIAQNWKDERNLRIAAEQKIEADKPKVLFADAVSTSKSSILIGELAKILKQNGIHIGQNRLFEWMRNNGYLIRRQGTDYNMPTQKSMELELFEIKETSVTHSDGHITVNKTPKVTGKGQIYFINLFDKSKAV